MTTTITRRILIVDDNKDSTRCLSVLLAHDGHEIRVAHDGSSALKLARSYQPDLVLLDIGLPDMDGFEVAQTLKREESSKGCTIVATSGFGDDEHRRRAAQAGCDHFLQKPLDVDLLMLTIGDTSSHKVPGALRS